MTRDEMFNKGLGRQWWIVKFGLWETYDILYIDDDERHYKFYNWGYYK